MSVHQGPEPKVSPTNVRIGCATAGVLGLLIGAVACNPIKVIDEGHVGLVTEFGRAQEGLRQPGVTMHNPFTQDVIEVETRTRASLFKDIEGASQEQQIVKVTGTINYALAQINIVELYRTVGLDFINRVFDSSRDSSVKTVTARYPVNEILARRQELQDAIRDQMNSDLGKHGIVVNDVFITNLAFSPEYTAAIEKKQVAQQEAEREKQVLVQREQQALQAVAAARGQAEANRVLSESITPALLEDKKLTKWDGKLPLVTSDASTLISLDAQR